MKNKRSIALVLVLLAALLAWWLWPWPVAEEASISGIATASQDTNALGTATPEPAAIPQSSMLPEVLRNLSGERERQRKQAEERSLNEWRTPIEFYGKVVDERGQPVEGVAVSFSCNDTSAEGTSFYQTVSDAPGGFSITGIKGKLLSVELKKPGYYTSQRDTRYFYYAGQNQNFVPNRSEPIIFHLRKIGNAEPLVVWSATHMVSISGKPLHIDAQTGKAAPDGEHGLTVEYVKGNPSHGKRYDWSFKISVPDGGLLPSTVEFDFIAPEVGYYSADEIMTAAADESWQARMNRNYFMKLADGNYARIMLDLMAHNGSLRISALLNPSGSRNLEYGEAAQSEMTPR